MVVPPRRNWSTSLKAPSGLEPHEVFTPTEFPLEDTHAYASREEPEKALVRFATRGRVPIVFGEYGVGKTTVVRRIYRDAEAEGRLVYVASAENKDLADIMRLVLERLNYTVDVERSSRVGGSFKVRLTAVEGGIDGGKEVTSRLVVDSPTDERVIELLAENSLILVIDEMHKSSDDFRQQLASFIKALRGQAGAQPPMVLIGTTLDAEYLVRHDPGIDRFVAELPIPPMTPDESREIVTEGFQLLQILIPDDLVDRVVATAAGAPTITQTLCLDMAELALEDGRTETVPADYEAAIERYITEHGRRQAALYMRSIEHVGPMRYRKHILKAMATMPQDFATMENLCEGVSALLGRTVPSTTISGPLRQLKEGNEPVLQDVERPDGDRVHNLTAFRDPMMKSFIRFMGEVESQGLLPQQAL